ncbi:hypothetical protein TTHERM_00607300 (macronuclear) [Tetrahymena thermophila SB210]|uniref:Uncharacterized protein n=1 Tax=Tetrahymena thermophila (strain SB210) TaxID=312017 RepID=Q22YG1_TETTS|nr:hypothetical protein TTHERM_00607300 [Tetrahymena thermophila SB210]EAR90324.1 hypothetical protein TTHERM_00607300 [Tetrahymena thermophila SB210]|eukprot:XP_001010569.1 hypothetical protein TTHERM_00607300 [Tetrahymena thermophila SB210]
MSQENKRKEIILNNILYLAQKDSNTKQSQRNVLNKWFQDAVKSYIMESVASPLIADSLRLHSSLQVKNFICSQTNKNKVKYMATIEQYFYFINKFNQNDLFIKKLKQIIYSPVDITQYNNELTYNTQKLVRKQFVCFLILKYFEIYGQQEFASFYELWNICFPQQLQTKKKLSKYDKKVENKQTKRQYRKKISQDDSSPTSSNNLSENTTHLVDQEYCFQNQDSFTKMISLNDQDSLNQSQTKLSEQDSRTYQTDFSSYKQPINNRIYEEETHDIEPVSYFLQFNNNDALSQNQEELANQQDLQANNFKYHENQQQLTQIYLKQEYDYQQNYDNSIYFDNNYQYYTHQQQNNNEFINQLNNNQQCYQFYQQI